MKTVLITGAAGFIGFHLAKRLLVDGAKVIGVDLDVSYAPTIRKARLDQLNTASDFRFERVDQLLDQLLTALFTAHKPDIVVHLAGQVGVRSSVTNPRDHVRGNVDGFVAVLEACRACSDVRHFLYASSSAVYGANKKTPFHEDDPVNAPVSPYAVTKRAGELLVESYSRLWSLQASGLRLFSAYGPWGRPDMAYWTFTDAAFAGKPVSLYGNGRVRRDFTFIDDVVASITKLIDNPPGKAALALNLALEAPHIIYNVGAGKPVEVEKLAQAIEKATGRDLVRRYLPMQKGDVPVTHADNGRLSKVTGETPQVALQDGVAMFVDWYLDFHNVAAAAA